MSLTINIANVIAELRATQGVEHEILFVYGKGKRQGEIGRFAQATYGAAIRSPAKPTKSGLPRQNAVWKKNGTIPILNLEKGKMVTLLISHLYAFDGYKIKH